MWRKDDSLRLLNWRQRRIAKSAIPNQCVIAGAGTGKTKVLIERIKQVLQKSQSKPEKVLVITFSAKAVDEIKKRLAKTSGGNEFNWVTTIHNFCRELLTKELTQGSVQNKFGFLFREEREGLINKLIKIDKLDFFKIWPKQFEELIRWQKLEKLSFEDSFNRVFKNFSLKLKKTEITNHIKNLYKIYLAYLSSRHLYDYEDSLIKTYELLKNDRHVLERWQNKFDFIFIDEFQDIDRVQYEIIRLLAQNKPRTFFVGDPDQSIYAWRGAIKNIEREITKDFNGIKCSILRRNYRSSKRIIAVANRLINFNKDRIKKKLYTNNETGKHVVYYHGSNQINEAKWIARKIKYLIESKQHCKLSDFAIICRNNSWSKAIEQELVINGLDYQLNHGEGFFDQIEIKNMVEWLKVISFKDNDTAVYNTCHTLLKINEQDLKAIEKFAKEYNTNLFNAFSMHECIANLSDLTHKAIEWFLIGLRKIEWAIRFKFGDVVNIVRETFKKKIGDLLDTQQENLDLFSQVVADFEKTHRRSSLASFLRQIIHYYEPLSQVSKNKNTGKIAIMTIHKSKGLEFPCVFIVGMINGVFPRNDTDLATLEEERRNFYVAITRAQEELYLSSCEWKKRHDDTPMKPSKFISEVKSLCKIEK